MGGIFYLEKIKMAQLLGLLGLGAISILPPFIQSEIEKNEQIINMKKVPLLIRRRAQIVNDRLKKVGMAQIRDAPAEFRSQLENDNYVAMLEEAEKKVGSIRPNYMYDDNDEAERTVSEDLGNFSVDHMAVGEARKPGFVFRTKKDYNNFVNKVNNAKNHVRPAGPPPGTTYDEVMGNKVINTTNEGSY